MSDFNLLAEERAEWIDGYEGRYMITDHGRVISFCTPKPTVLKAPLWEGYPTVNIRKYGIRKTKTLYIHRAVAEKFCLGYQDGFTVNHKDLNKLNNHFTNLEWIPSSANIKHGWDNGIYSHLSKIFGKAVIGKHGKTGEEIFFESFRKAAAAGFDRVGIGRSIRTKGKHHGYYWRHA